MIENYLYRYVYQSLIVLFVFLLYSFLTSSSTVDMIPISSAEFVKPFSPYISRLCLSLFNSVLCLTQPFSVTRYHLLIVDLNAFCINHLLSLLLHMPKVLRLSFTVFNQVQCMWFFVEIFEPHGLQPCSEL